MKGNRLTKTGEVLSSPQNVSSENIGYLFHYTYEDKKEKIVAQDKVVFQLSRVDEFLDKNEGFQILEPFYHACGDLYENGVIAEPFYKILVSIKQKDLSNSFSGAWVLCFSKNGNSNFLKRRYAAGNGWILGLRFNNLDDICTEFPEEFGTITLYEIRYSFDKLLRIIKSTIKKYYKLYKQAPTEDSLCKKMITRWLSEYSLIYKSTDYKLEEEIRLLCKFAPDFSSWKNEKYGVQFESSVNGYCANVKMILDKKRLIYASQKLDTPFDTRLNKTIIAGHEIHTVLK